MGHPSIDTRMTDIPVPPTSSSDMDDVIDLSALIGTLWRSKWIIALITGIALLLGGYFAYIGATPLYRAKSVVILEPQQEQIVSFDAVAASMSGDDSEVNSEVQVLQSRELIRKVVEQLDLVNDPEFNEALRTPSALASAKAWVKSLLLGLPPARELGIDPEQRALDGTVSAVLRTLSIRNLPNSYVLEITAETENPKKSALLADTVADQYILDQIAAKYEATEQASSWLSERVAELQAELESAETALANFSSGIDLVSPEALQLKERQIKDLRDRIASVTALSAENAALVTALQETNDPIRLATAAGDPDLLQLGEQLQETPENAALRTRFETRAGTVTRRAELEATRAATQLQALENSLATLEVDFDQQSRDLIQLQQLTREAEASRLLYEYFLGRLKETSVQQGIQQADARVLSYSVTPSAPSAPNKSLILAMSGLLGGMLGSGLILILEARQSTFRTGRDLEHLTGQSVFGQVPLFPFKARNRAIAYLIEKPNSVAAEAIRNLRTSVLLSNVDRPAQVIMMTSAVPGEGKTTLTLALSNNFAGMGRKVLVIEGDIRRRIFGQYLEGKKAPEQGLIAALSGEAAPEDVIIHNEGFDVDLLLAERKTVNAADLFSSQKFADLITYLKQHYDTILIDTPPVLVVPDARVIAQCADTVLFVVGWDKTRQDQVREALHQLAMVNRRPAGLILNQISASGMKRYGHGGQYGYYAGSGYGSKYYTN